jgi:heptosyltransferase-2
MKILFIRGGAIGDFIITFPALEMLRAQWPEARIEILGQASTARLALNRRYAQAVRSVDQAGISHMGLLLRASIDSFL